MTVSTDQNDTATSPEAGGAPPARVRRSPVQGRSQETVQRILGGASRLLGRGVPIEEMTTALIAAEASVSVGALYRFFPDKQAIVDAIAVRHIETFQEELVEMLIGAPPTDGASFLNAVLDAFVAYLDRHPDFRTVAYGAPGGGRYVSRPTHEAHSGPNAGGAALVKWFMTEGLGITPSPEIDLRLRIATETGDRLLAFAFEQPTAEQRRAVLDQAKSLLVGYLFG
ncbi:MAG TPA: TetR/AcrR family transcriptional regulator [Stellaceae bacterium]|nr:TetR/AcrR family transcriptional regulator [Stellaceae bacterium]